MSKCVGAARNNPETKQIVHWVWK